MRTNIKNILSAIIIISALSTGCKKFVELGLPSSQILSEQVFSSDVTATAAMTGIYHDLNNDFISFASGGSESITARCGLSADELLDFYDVPDRKQFELNTLLANNPGVGNLWTTMYKAIYAANAVIDGVSASTIITDPVKKQLTGEALFVRAFAHFYLVNLFGDVPLALNTDYKLNAQLSRTDKNNVYAQIVADLGAASDSLSENYVTVEKVRPNKFTAIALLARAYLYTGEWEKAATESGKIIDRQDIYSLPVPENVFIKNSDEAIWQLMPVNTDFNATGEGSYFIIEFGIESSILRPGFQESFETGDNRKTAWIGTFEDPSGTVYFPYKYKVKYSDVLTEYSMIFRLAEQYLIRAEARIHIGDLDGAKEDIDKIRDRAGLDPLAASDENALTALNLCEPI